MTNLEKLEQEVERLSPPELQAFRRWFQEYDSAAWDQQIESDIGAGKLEQLRQEAIEEHQARRTREI